MSTPEGSSLSDISVESISPPEAIPPVRTGNVPLAGTTNGKTDDDLAAIRGSAEIQRQLLQLELDDKANEVANRKTYTSRLFFSLVGWMVFVGLLVVVSGARCRIMTISDPVLITLLGTTTLNVIGVFVFVAKYLFPHRSSRPKDETRA